MYYCTKCKGESPEAEPVVSFPLHRPWRNQERETLTRCLPCLVKDAEELLFDASMFIASVEDGTEELDSPGSRTSLQDVVQDELAECFQSSPTWALFIQALLQGLEDPKTEEPLFLEGYNWRGPSETKFYPTK